MNVITVQAIYEYMDKKAPFATAFGYDNVGLLVGSGQAAVSSVLLALDITPEVVAEAKQLGAELIISHHPVIFEPLRALTEQQVPYLLAQSGIAAICAHTNLDLAEGGVNTCLANALGLQQVRGLKAYGNTALWEGRIGELPRTYSAAEFAAYVKTALSCGGLKYTDSKCPVRTVALCGGAGADLLEDAVAAGADAFVTSDTKHHQLLLANQLGMTLVDAGHFNTENVVVEPLAQKLQEQFPTVRFQKSAVLADPVQYL